MMTLQRSPVCRRSHFSRSIAVGLLLLSSAAAQAKTLGYITNYGTNSVTVFDAETNQVVGPPIAVGSQPVDIVASRDGRHVYVLNQAANQANGTVSVIDTASSLTVATLLVGHQPRGIAVSPDAKRVYVVNDTLDVPPGGKCPVGNASPGQTRGIGRKADVTMFGHLCASISVVDTETGLPVSVVDLSTHLPALTINYDGDVWFKPAVSPDGASLYVTGHNGGAQIDTKTNKIVRFGVGNGVDVAVDPYAKVWEADDFYCFNSIVYDPTNAFSNMFNFASNHVATSPTEAYFSVVYGNGCEASKAPNIAVFDNKGNYPLKGTIDLGNIQEIGDVAFRPDGAFAYVLVTANGGVQSYFTIDTATRKIVGQLQPAGCLCEMVVVVIPQPAKVIILPPAFHAGHF